MLAAAYAPVDGALRAHVSTSLSPDPVVRVHGPGPSELPKDCASAKNRSISRRPARLDRSLRRVGR